MSVALERRVEIPFEIAVNIEGHDQLAFLPWGAMADRAITGPLPADSPSLIAEVFRQVAGLAVNDLVVIGPAISMLYGALLLHDKDIRSAYTLLVAGLETLSRKYGQPPTDWNEWDASTNWEGFIVENALSDAQAEALRTRLMENLQLRLKATFRSYASSRLPSSFWEERWVEWMYPLQLPQGTWDAPTKMHEGQIRDFLPDDRKVLSKLLGLSYDLRSCYVHKGTWFGPLELTLDPKIPLDISRPMPFAVLRAILRTLILIELSEHSQGGVLPDMQLQRGWISPDA